MSKKKAVIIITMVAVCALVFVLLSRSTSPADVQDGHNFLEHAIDDDITFLDNNEDEVTAMADDLVTIDVTLESSSLYVSPDGSDVNDGSEGSPFYSIQRAVNAATPLRELGTVTIYLREGMYFQQFMVFDSRHDPSGRDRPQGAEPAFLEIRNFPDETAVIDGSLMEVVEQGQHQMIVVRNSDYVRIYGLTIQNNAPINYGFNTPGAVLVETMGTASGGSQGVQIVNNTILGMDGDTFGYPTPSAPGSNGSAIQVLGRSQLEENALRDVLVAGNEVGYCRTGWTESIVFAGNVSDFVIENNFVHNNNNIGINVIGLWGWITGVGDGANARADWNRARRGVVDGNVVINNIGYSNHASEGCGGSSGIYVDGAMDITISNNFVSGSSIGISVGTEPYHARWGSPEPVMARDVRIHNNIIANNRQGAVLLGGTFGAFDLDIRHNTMVGREIIRGASGGVNGVVNINNNSSGREVNRNFHFENNIIISFIDSRVPLSDPGHVIRYLNSGWNDNSADLARAGYLSFRGNVVYGRLINGSGSIEAALPSSTLMDDNVRAASSPIAGMNFDLGVDSGDFSRTEQANGAGADVEAVKEAMGNARLPLFDIAMADYRAFVSVLPAAAEIRQHLIKPSVRGSLDAPLSLSRVGRNIARYFEREIRNIPESTVLPIDSPQRHESIIGILNWAYGYEPEPISGYAGRLSVQPGFLTDNAYRGIVSFGYGNEGDIDFGRVAGLDAPWTLGSVKGEPDASSRYPSVRFFVMIPYFNEAAGRTSYIVRGFSTPSWWRGLPEAGAVLAITAEDIHAARMSLPSNRYVCADTGDDENDGAFTRPWKTVSHAVGQLWHGDTLFLRGYFHESVVIPISASGNRGNPTTITNWAGHEATIDGDGTEFAIYMAGVDNIVIRNISLQNSANGVFVGNADRSGLRNFQSNWWDMRSIGPSRDDVYGLGMMRDITILNINSNVVVSDDNPFAPIHGVRID